MARQPDPTPRVPARRRALALFVTGLLGLAAAPAADVDFPHGVASGEVTWQSAVLWGASDRTATLKVEVFTNASLRPPKVFQATRRATQATGHTVKVVAHGLAPDTRYWYRWRRGNDESAIGTFRTAPAPETARSVRFAFSGDSDGTRVDGVPVFNDFEVLDAVRADEPDFFVYLGDLIYSDSAARPTGPAITLEEYRDTWRENRSYRALTDLLAAVPIFSIWDDHEVQNDYDGQTVDPLRYANGRRAYFEFVPTLQSGLLADPTCAGDPLFKVFHWGSEVDLIVLDERSCRSADVEAACQGDLAPTLPSPFRVLAGLPPAPPPGCLEALADPSRTFLGPVQKEAFKEALLESTARWKFVINELPIQQLWVVPYDRWEGYAAERAEILDFLRDEAIPGVVFLTTDIHANVVNEVFEDAFTAPTPVAREFVTGPIARSTFAQNVIDVSGPEGLELLQVVLATLAGVDCQALDVQSWTSVDVDATDGTATLAVRDAAGAVVPDDLTAQPCVQTITP